MADFLSTFAVLSHQLEDTGNEALIGAPVDKLTQVTTASTSNNSVYDSGFPVDVCL